MFQTESIGMSVEYLHDHKYPGVFMLQHGELQPLLSDVGLPLRVRNRLFMHEKGFCGMYACFIDLNQEWGLEDLRNIASQSGIENSKVGLSSKVNSVVIRTRDVSNSMTPQSGRIRMGGTNAMLMVDQIWDRHPLMTSLSKEYHEEKLDSVYDPLSWWKTNRVVQNSVCLVHEENANAQEEAIHARVGVLSDGSHEFSMGTGVRHARVIGENGYPYVNMVGHELEFMLNMIAEGRGGGLPGFASNDWSSARKMARDMVEYVTMINRAMDVVRRHAGRNVVLEMRLYRAGLKDAGLHIYDFDNALAKGGFLTLSGLRPSGDYLADMNKAEK